MVSPGSEAVLVFAGEEAEEQGVVLAAFAVLAVTVVGGWFLLKQGRAVRKKG
jgi:hypothetical protein